MLAGPAVPIHVCSTDPELEFQTKSLPCCFVYTGKLVGDNQIHQFPACSTEEVIIHAAKTNKSYILLGSSDLDSNSGFELDPGETVKFPLAVLDCLHMQSIKSGDYLTYIAFAK